MARPKQYLSERKDFHLLLDLELLRKVEERMKQKGFKTLQSYLAKLVSDDILFWEMEQRQELIKSFK